MQAPPRFRSSLLVVDREVGQDAVTGGAVRADQAGPAGRGALDSGAGGASWGASAHGASGVGVGAASTTQGVSGSTATGDRCVGGGHRRLAGGRPGRTARPSPRPAPRRARRPAAARPARRYGAAYAVRPGRPPARRRSVSYTHLTLPTNREV